MTNSKKKKNRTETIGKIGKELSNGLAAIYQEWESKSLAIRKGRRGQSRELNLLQHSQRAFMVFLHQHSTHITYFAIYFLKNYVITQQL